MSSFKSLKDKLKGKSSSEETISSPKPNTPTPKTIDDHTLSLEESRYIMNLIASSDFKGADVQIIYNIVLKLQTNIKKYLDTDG